MFTPIWGRFPVWRSYFSIGLNQTTNHRHLLYANHIHTIPHKLHLGTIWTCGNFGPFIRQALAYLHGLPQPIIHRDLKPSPTELCGFWDGVFFSTECRHAVYICIYILYTCMIYIPNNWCIYIYIYTHIFTDTLIYCPEKTSLLFYLFHVTIHTDIVGV